MKILPLSDLHLEFDSSYTPHIEVNDRDTVVVLAGDIHIGDKAIEWIADWCDKVKAVVYTPGNHEYYGHEFTTLDAKIKQKVVDYGLTNVHFLNNSSVVIDNTKFIGSTLWTCLNNQNIIDQHTAALLVADYKKIIYHQGEEFRKLLPEDTINQHLRSVRYLEDEIDKEFSGNIVVLTHHLPSWSFIGGTYRESNVNGAYAAHLDALLEKYQKKIDLWVFGHSHSAEVFDTAFETLFIQNCRGVCGYGLVNNFTDKLRIELLPVRPEEPHRSV